MNLKKIFIYLVLFLGMFSIVNADLNDYVVSSWHLNNTATDDAGSSDLTVTGATYTSTNCIIGNCIDFDGTSDYAIGTMSSQSSSSVSMWIYVDSLSGNPILFEGGGDSSNVWNRLQLLTDGDIAVSANYGGGGGWHTSVSTSTPITIGNLYHIVGSVEQGLQRLWVNGVNVFNDTYNFPPPLTSTFVGLSGSYLHSSEYNGRMDEVIVFNKSLNYDEVQQIYNSGIGERYPFAAAATPGINIINETIDDENFGNLYQKELTQTQKENIITDDSYTVQNAPTTNFGSATTINVKSKSTLDNRRGYFGINLSQSNINYYDLTNMSFFYNVNSFDSSTINVAVYYCEDTFDESTIIWNNQDTEVTNCDDTPFYLKTLNTYSTGYNYINLTDILLKRNNEFTLKFVLDPEDSASDIDIVIATSEAGGNKPYIDFQSKLRYVNGSDVKVILNVTDTNSNVNSSYQLNGGSSTQFGTNTLRPNVTLSSLLQGLNEINFTYENNETSTNSNDNIFYYDNVNPNASYISNQTEFDTFTVNMTNLFNFSDNIGVYSCLIDVLELENATINDTIANVDCLDTVLFQTAGRHTLNLTVTDLAGNSFNLLQNITINPFIHIFFNDTTNGSLVEDYTATIYHPDGRVTTPVIQDDFSIRLSPINDGVLDLGTHQVQFERLGFKTENFTVEVNDTTVFNETFNVTRSLIIVKVFDRETGNLISGSTTTITLVSDVGFNTTTTTGEVNISDINFISGDYILIADNPNYATETVYFTYTNQEDLEVNVYMLSNSSTDAGTITIIAVATTGQLIQGAICKALEWKPASSSYVAVAQGLTDTAGRTILNIEIASKLYKFSCTKAGVTAITNAQIIQIDGSSLTVIMEDAGLVTSAILTNVDFSLVEQVQNSTHSRFKFTFNDNDGLVSQGCIKSYRVEGTNKQLLEQNCTSSSTGIIYSSVISVNNSYDLLVEAVLTSGNIDVVVDSIVKKSSASIQEFLSDYNFDILIPIVFTLIGIVIGLVLKPQNIYISEIAVIVLVWLSVLIVPSVISSTIAVFVSVIAITMMLGGYKRK